MGKVARKRPEMPRLWAECRKKSYYRKRSPRRPVGRKKQQHNSRRKSRALPKGEGPALLCRIQKNDGLKPADPDSGGHGHRAQRTPRPAGGAHAQQGGGLGCDQRKEQNVRPDQQHAAAHQSVLLTERAGKQCQHARGQQEKEPLDAALVPGEGALAALPAVIAAKVLPLRQFFAAPAATIHDGASFQTGGFTASPVPRPPWRPDGRCCRPAGCWWQGFCRRCTPRCGPAGRG